MSMTQTYGGATLQLLSVIGTFFSPIYVLMVIVGMAIFFDTYAGRWAARKKAIRENKDPRIEVSSKLTRKGALSKALMYNLVIFTIYLIDHHMVNQAILQWIKFEPFAFFLTKVTTLFIVWIEFDSIDEHYYSVHGIRIKDKIKKFFEGLKKLIQNILEFKKWFKSNDK